MVAKRTAAPSRPVSGAAKKAVPAKAANKTAAKKSATKKTAPAKKAAAKNAATNKAAAKKTVATKAVAKKTAATKSPAKKTTANKSPAAAKRGAAAKPPTPAPASGSSGSSGSSGKATPVKKAASAKKAAPATRKASEPVKPVKKRAASAVKAAKSTKTGAQKVVAKKTAAGTAMPKATPVPTARIAVPGELPVQPGEDPWTAEEVDEARTELLAEGTRLRAEIATSEAAVAGLLRDSGDGAGDDQADTGTKNITREHEMSLAANAREMLAQTEHALERLDTGTYGLCESCGNPIGKARMQAFPRATLCMECKQKQERR
ncbi:TraR/DksA family transcriptional regulator [Actinacidiphila soli]|uniref:TraR/DksA family transcriptional regulator n=1 Tax=Actinacidiphila soli TaxID=2487275 RepID=UPI000FCAB2EC|nr:TraR/DksA family transcriptional regulator [Actinacidiphila soli]